MSEKTILSVKDIVKTYPGVVAIDHVSFDVREGEVHALIGENGAGKSTLIKTLSGAITPDSGTITIDGKSFSSLTPATAKEQGISVIYQEFTLIPGISAAENVFLGEKTTPGIFVDIKDRERRTKELFDQMGVSLDPSQKVRSLSPAMQQIVEIAKAISKNVKILIMDEPTAPLTTNEVTTLFRIIRDLKARGVTIIFISHRLEELFAVADRVTVMRDGQYVATKNIAEIDRPQLIAMMAGREMKESYPTRKSQIGEEMLRVEHLTVAHPYIANRNLIEDVSFTVRAGEVLGMAGLVGAGRSEVCMAIYGMLPVKSGKVFINGKEFKPGTTEKSVRSGLNMVSEDRKVYGLNFVWDIKTNIAISNLGAVSSAPFVKKKRLAARAGEYFRNLRVKAPTMHTKVGTLSGGNQQKVVIARSLNTNPRIIILDEPTKGIDVGSKNDIYNIINDMAAEGAAVIMISSELPELMGMSDRYVVMAEGRVVGELSREEGTDARIMEMAVSTFK